MHLLFSMFVLRTISGWYCRGGMLWPVHSRWHQGPDFSVLLCFSVYCVQPSAKSKLVSSMSLKILGFCREAWNQSQEGLHGSIAPRPLKSLSKIHLFPFHKQNWPDWQRVITYFSHYTFIQLSPNLTSLDSIVPVPLPLTLLQLTVYSVSMDTDIPKTAGYCPGFLLLSPLIRAFHFLSTFYFLLAKWIFFLFLFSCVNLHLKTYFWQAFSKLHEF